MNALITELRRPLLSRCEVLIIGNSPMVRCTAVDEWQSVVARGRDNRFLCYSSSQVSDLSATTIGQLITFGGF